MISNPSAAERWLALWLRLGGLVCATALVAMVMPRSWHAATHAWLGLGEFPEAPIAEYLARSMSGMCGFYGLLLIGLARNVRTQRPIIIYQALGLQGTSLLATLVMADSGMPAWWLYGDLGAVWGFNLAVLALAGVAGKTKVA